MELKIKKIIELEDIINLLKSSTSVSYQEVFIKKIIFRFN